MKIIIVTRQIGVEDSKYAVIGDRLITGHATQPNSGPKIA